MLSASALPRESLGWLARAPPKTDALSRICEFLRLTPPPQFSLFSIPYSQCVGMTSGGEDFERFIGREKADEFKALFSSWIHKIYRSSFFRYTPFEPHLISPPATSDWHLYSLKGSAASPNDVSTDLGSERAGDEENAEGDGVSADVQSTILPKANLATNRPSDSAANDSSPASPTKGSTGITPLTQGEDALDPDTQDRRPDHHTSLNDANPPTSLDSLPMNTRESMWMKSKGTLKYFRGVHKMGKLSDLTFHWYKLEEALGFQESVGHLTA